MKDDRLEKQFEEYFKGVNISDDITADAKASVSPRRRIMPKIVKFASIAASIVLVFAVAISIIFRNDFNKGSSVGNSSGDSSPSAPESPSEPGDSDPPAGGAPDFEGDSRFVLYADSDINRVEVSAYSLTSLDTSLKLIENFALADNADVTACNAGYMGGKLALVEASVSLLNGFIRDETTIFVEFTESRLVYDGVADYYDGKLNYYYGAQYYLTSITGENGEPEFKLHILYKGVKYYFNVRSSDRYAYEKYLNLVTGK